MSWATRQETLSLIHCFPFLQFDKLINVFFTQNSFKPLYALYDDRIALFQITSDFQFT